MIETLKEVGYEGYLSAKLLPEPDPDTAARAIELIDYRQAYDERGQALVSSAAMTLT